MNYKIYLKTGQIIECSTEAEMSRTFLTLGEQVRKMETLINGEWIVTYKNTGY